MSRSIHLDLDGAWAGALPSDLDTLEAREWGPKLRFSAPPRGVEAFYLSLAGLLPPFLVYGSGDFHHLSGLWVRRLEKPFTLLSFDNHPDWDIRPPKWCCGSWINRALDLPHLERASIWGCGNFECWWPQRIFGNHRAVRSGRLEVHPWADQRPPRDQQRPGVILRENWREHFAQFAASLQGRDIYVTVDLDCLRGGKAMTNWENGQFTADDVAWALRLLRGHAKVIAGDVCGAYSLPVYARRKQRFAAEMDHPKLPPPEPSVAVRVNREAFDVIWPALAG